MTKKKENKSTQKSIRVSKELKDFDIQINSFGEIISNYDVDKINEFLNQHVDDKKLRNRKKNQKEETSEESNEIQE